MDNWSWIEVVWTLTAAIGVYFSSRNVRLGSQDSRALDKVPAKDRNLRWALLRIIAKGNFRRDAMRLVAQGIFLGIGVVAGNIPTSPNGLSVTAIAFGLAFTVPSMLLTASAIGDFNDRLRSIEIGKIIEAQEKHVI